jgi:hypothetical protein
LKTGVTIPHREDGGFLRLENSEDPTHLSDLDLQTAGERSGSKYEFSNRGA